MPVLHLDPNDPNHFNQQLGEFKGITNALDNLAADLRELDSRMQRMGRWARDLGPEYNDLAAFLGSLHSGMRRMEHRVSIVSQTFEETWDIGEALRRVFHHRKEPTPFIDLTRLDVTIGKPPTDEEIKDLLHG